MEIGEAMRGKLIEVDGNVQVKDRPESFCWFEPEGTANTFQTLPLVIVNTICEHIPGKRIIVIRREQYLEAVREI